MISMSAASRIDGSARRAILFIAGGAVFVIAGIVIAIPIICYLGLLFMLIGLAYVAALIFRALPRSVNNGAGGIAPRTPPGDKDNLATSAGSGKTAAICAMFVLLGLSLLTFSAVLENFPPDSSDSGTLGYFWTFTSMCVVAAGAQVYYVVAISNDWESLSRPDQGGLVFKGIFLPPLIALGSFLVIAIAIAALGIWLFASGNGSSGSSSSSGGAGPRNVKDDYGNRLGSLNSHTGEVKDRYGNRLGSLDSRTGEVKDRYGNRVGWLD